MEVPSAWSLITSWVSLWVIWLDFLESALASLAWPATILIAVFVFRREALALLPKLSSIKAGGVEALFAHGISDLTNEPSKQDVPSAQAEPETPEAQSFSDASPDSHDESSQGSHEANETIEPTKPPTAPVDAPNSLIPDSSDGDATQLHDEAESEYNLSEYDRFVIGEAAYRDFRDARTIAKSSPSGAVLLAWRALETVLLKAAWRSRKKGDGRPLRPHAVLQDLTLKGLIPQSSYGRFLRLRELRNAVAHSSEFNGSYEDVMEYITLTEDLTHQLGRTIPPHRK